MAIACFCGFPAAISILMFSEIPSRVAAFLPRMSGIGPPFLGDITDDRDKIKEWICVFE